MAFGLDAGLELPILILIVVILLFGAKKIPELARGVGRALGEFKRGKMEIEREIAQSSSAGAAPAAGGDGITAAAKELGLIVEGRNEAELRGKILEEIPKRDRVTVVSVAKAFRIDVEGIGVDELKERILVALQ
ncbi:MAG: twin-arginine translocase TatA/TatE family subunit [Thermoplasmata archaeon]